jgi:hypothetical protein
MHKFVSWRGLTQRRFWEVSERRNYSYEIDDKTIKKIGSTNRMECIKWPYDQL